jgi:hypothetical protein
MVGPTSEGGPPVSPAVQLVTVVVIVIVVALAGILGALHPLHNSVPLTGQPTISFTLLSSDGFASVNVTIGGPANDLVVINESAIFTFSYGDCKAGDGGPSLQGTCMVEMVSLAGAYGDSPQVSGRGSTSPMPVGTEVLFQRAAVDSGLYEASASAGDLGLGISFNFSVTLTIATLGYVPATD